MGVKVFQSQECIDPGPGPSSAIQCLPSTPLPHAGWGRSRTAYTMLLAHIDFRLLVLSTTAAVNWLSVLLMQYMSWSRNPRRKKGGPCCSLPRFFRPVNGYQGWVRLALALVERLFAQADKVRYCATRGKGGGRFGYTTGCGTKAGSAV